MARLRSASVAKASRTDPVPDPVTPGGTKPTFSRITEQSTKLNSIIEHQTTPDSHSPQHLDSVLDSFKSTTPLSPPSGPEDQPYPSLDSLLEKKVKPTSSMSKSKTPVTAKKGGAAAKTEPMTPMKKGASGTPFKVPEGEGGFGFNFSSSLAMQGRKLLNGLTGKKTPATPSSATPATESTTPAAAPPATPSTKKNDEEDFTDTTAPRGSQTEPRPLKKKKRFSDIHRQQFSKMDSIATHYAAKRVTPNPPKIIVPASDITPKNAVLTPEMAPKGIKRTKSQAVLSDREIPVSPSPVKVQQPRMPDDDREENPSPVKRQKLDPSQAALKRKPSKIAKLTAGTPMKSAEGRYMGAPNTVATGALGRGLFLKAPSSTRKMPALPRPVSRLNLTPATTLSASPSKIPTTPGRAPRFRSTRNAPATAGGSKLNTMINFAETVSSAPSVPSAPSESASTSSGSYELPTLNLSTPAKGTPKPPPTTVGGFTFRSRGSGLGFGALSEIHKKKMEMPKFSGGMGTPKVSENDPAGVEDPFATVMEKGNWEEKSEDIGWAVGTPSAGGKKSGKKNNKRKDVHPDDEIEEQGQQEEETMQEEDERRMHEERVSSPKPARKKLRFDTASGREKSRSPALASDPMEEKDETEEKKPPQTLAEAVAKANRKRRLNFLATPKKRVAGEGDKLGRGRSLWK